jgi:hypothetical protein
VGVQWSPTEVHAGVIAIALHLQLFWKYRLSISLDPTKRSERAIDARPNGTHHAKKPLLFLYLFKKYTSLEFRNYAFRLAFAVCLVPPIEDTELQAIF